MWMREISEWFRIRIVESWGKKYCRDEGMSYRRNWRRFRKEVFYLLGGSKFKKVLGFDNWRLLVVFEN